jgi:K+-transporting ATPase KdpF subunit
MCDQEKAADTYSMIRLEETKKHVGHRFHRSNGVVFYSWSFLRSWLRTFEVRSELMHAGDAALLVICALLVGYLLYALLKAEEF